MVLKSAKSFQDTTYFRGTNKKLKKRTGSGIKYAGK
jgi:hypothetical protein